MKNGQQATANALADEGLFLRYAEEINRRGHLTEYAVFYFNVEGLQEISDKYGFRESRKVMRQYAAHLQRFINNFLVGLWGTIL